MKDGELDGKALCQFSGTLCDPLCGVCEAAEGRAGRIAPDRFQCANRIEICGVIGVDRLQAHQVAGQGDGLGVKGFGGFGFHGSWFRCDLIGSAGGRQVVGGPSRDKGERVAASTGARGTGWPLGRLGGANELWRPTWVARERALGGPVVWLTVAMLTLRTF